MERREFARLVAAGTILGGDEVVQKGFGEESLRGCVDDANVVETISELREYPEVSGPQSTAVVVLGYHAPGDGGGGLFFWSDDATGEADGGRTIASPQRDDGFWKRFSDQSVYNVRWWGARGNGTANDAPAIQAALDAAIRATQNRRADRHRTGATPGAGAPTVFLPPGTYALSKGLHIVPPEDPGITHPEQRYHLPVRLAGAGQGTVVRLASNAIDNCLTVDGMAASPGFMVGPIIDRLVVDGGYHDGATVKRKGETVQNGIYLRRVQHATVSGVRVQHTARDGIRSIGCFYNKYSYTARQIGGNALFAYQNSGIQLDLQARIEPSTFTNEGAGVYLEACTGFVVRPGTVFEHFRVSVRVRSCKGCFFSGTIASYAGEENVLIEGSSSRIFFDHCKIVSAGQDSGENHATSGIRIRKANERIPSWIGVRNCHFTNWDLSEPTQMIGIHWDANRVSGFLLEGCTFSADHEEYFQYPNFASKESSGYRRILGNVDLDGVPVRSTARGTAQIRKEEEAVVVDSNIHPQIRVRSEFIQVTATSSLGAASHFWVEASGDSRFTIHVDKEPRQVVTFNWMVDASDQ